MRALTEREYAKRRGCAHSTVQAARNTGRLSTSVTRDAGRIWVDPDLADREWEAGTLSDRAPLTGPTAPRLAPVAAVKAIDARPHLELVGLEDVERPGAPSLAIHFPLDRFIVGAAAALRKAGKAPTPAALRAAVDAVDVATWWHIAYLSLAAVLDDDKPPPREAIASWWETAGREAARGSQGTSHGE